MDPLTAGGGVEDVAWVAVDDPSAAGAARRAAEQLASTLGMPAPRAAEVGLAVTEIAGNIQRHGGGGALLLRAVRVGETGGVEVVAMDSGPGIRDLAAARRDGSSTRGTLGIGLGAIERLADTFEIGSAPGRGTILIAGFEADRRAAGTGGPVTAAGITRPLDGEDVCGDAYAVRGGLPLSLMLCDGSGHGPLAASASREAARTFRDPTQPGSPPEAVVARIDRILNGTRGGAVAVAELDPAAGLVRFAGVGNIGAAVVSSTDKRGMVSIAGVAGYRTPRIRAFSYPLSADAVVILHSDGVSARWTRADVGGLLGRSPTLIAATLLRDFGGRRDDACVLVGRAGP